MSQPTEELFSLIRDLREDQRSMNEKVSSIQADVSALIGRDVPGMVKDMEARVGRDIDRLRHQIEDIDEKQAASEKAQSRAWGYLTGIVAAGGASGAAVMKMAERLLGG